MTRVVVACGALALHVKQIAARRGWEIEVRPVPPELHNRPKRIRAAVEQAVAGEGAKIAALSLSERAAAQAVLDEVQYVELSGRTDFNDLFVDQLQFPG